MIFTHFCFYRCVCIYLIVLVQNYCEVNIHKRCILGLEYTIASVSTWQNVVLQPIEVYKEVFICTQNFHRHGTEFNECLKSPNMGFSNQGKEPVYIKMKYRNCSLNKGFRNLPRFIFSFIYLFIYLIIRQNLKGFIYVIASDEVLYIHRQHLYISPNSDLWGIH